MASVLIISFVEWAGAFQRPQHMAVELARAGWEVTYASPGYVHRRGQRVESGVERPAGLRVVEPAALPGGGRWGWMRRVNRGLMARGLRGATRGVAGGTWDAVVFNDPQWAGVAAGVPARRRVFDCMDDLSAAGPGGGLGTSDAAREAEALEAEALRVADLVWTGTASLADRLGTRHRSVTFIPCGVDAEHFGAPKEEDVRAAAAELPGGEGPLAGYFGVLNERFDMERVRALMRAGWRVLLIGPSTSRAPEVPEDERIRWIGPRPYSTLPGYLAHFDLALIPYDIEGPHRFLYPVKALEYLAGGKRVLSTPLPDVVRFLKDYVELADGVGEWEAAGKRLAGDGDAGDAGGGAESFAKAEAGRGHVGGRTWAAMGGEMMRELGEGLGESRG